MFPLSRVAWEKKDGTNFSWSYLNKQTSCITQGMFDAFHISFIYYQSHFLYRKAVSAAPKRNDSDQNSKTTLQRESDDAGRNDVDRLRDGGGIWAPLLRPETWRPYAVLRHRRRRVLLCRFYPNPRFPPQSTLRHRLLLFSLHTVLSFNVQNPKLNENAIHTCM